MEPRAAAEKLLAITRAKAKLVEYSVPPKYHFEMLADPSRLFLLAVGILGDEAAAEAEGNYEPSRPAPTRFSAYFFDAYLRSGIGAAPDEYTLLLASASYYLCNLAGSSLVLAREVANDDLVEHGGVTQLLHAILIAPEAKAGRILGAFRDDARDIAQRVSRYMATGEDESELSAALTAFRKDVYARGSSRELLACDLVAAVVQRRLANSTWRCIPTYTGLTTDLWSAAFKKSTFMRELWPAQHLLGRKGVFLGSSAVVQMPTSAGKSRATELIIRSGFLAKRTSTAVVVAPFRALCHEIRRTLRRAFAGEDVKVDEYSDVLQMDIDFSGIEDAAETHDGPKNIIVVTPEKLLYVLRHNPGLARSVGIIVLDEGHQFDSGTRGVTYELLITSLKSLLPEHAQKVLISAVISNAQAVNEWLNAGRGQTIEGVGLLPTYRTVAFSSWKSTRGQLQFVELDNPEVVDFFVPRVLIKSELNLRGKERNRQFFPEPASGADVALYLALKLVANGGLAIFCGKKTSANSLAIRLVDIFKRGLKGKRVLPSPLAGADKAEVGKLTRLYGENLGQEAPETKSASLGVFTHHGNTPHGIRLAVEYALSEGLVRFVICTSTLAQGVNLPIRYLLVSGTRQGLKQISVRDFQNLMGRYVSMELRHLG